ncbi:MAG: aminotransferase class I/II-fold pyridoxal phosphate-dependent enzyme [Meiothermus sp.]|uniref:pyridoxal phosphate-dependent aminotransferase n=1 Tax=Meiothermus sp. TaxID=1955249 RepID=UPI0025DCDC6C|nr:aminotransferase class I/II-fold pyridoxal phosphate-dependent enzyme [Meiothermus sp.]MCS7058523.1 aminotransferase class I/II-fold pyridoxal phosphate-dependent enzyme [Meiothermus sp.]MCS7195427.1 aminotransferase class I/II-fold pyridoxal phosphate-dependent enzyme [Meiothermus sp.]MDW8091054.1 aminotransferase class I/II-fold pyridoxal phosphate-dependent enzyme [Meiothermus sp.]MDW8480943.1 aminotransferase class I/II-fold pyridoxal phosphate-dependent enzyme [Meiothermus sp.]
MKAFKPHLGGLPSYPYQGVEAPIKLDQNESPYDLPAELKARVVARLAALSYNRYPHLHAEDVRERLSAWLGWPMEGLVLSPGSNLLIQALAQAAAVVLDTAPSFPHYAFSARIAATPYRAVPLGEGFALPLEGLLRAMDEGPGVLFLANPHAPTGRLFAPGEVAQLAERARETGWLLVIDEAYHQFSGTDHTELARANPQVALLRTFSKAFGLGGIRAGYLMASPEVARVLQNFIPPFGLPAHTAQVLLAVLEAPEYVEGVVRSLVAERERLYEALQAHPTWRAYPSQTNFLLIRTPDAASAYQGLLRWGILVRRQDQYPGLEGCIRVSVGIPEENDRFLQAAFALAEVPHA